MVKEVEAKGYEAFQKAADENKDKVVFALFCGDVDDQGKSWCPDCVVGMKILSIRLRACTSCTTASVHPLVLEILLLSSCF